MVDGNRLLASWTARKRKGQEGKGRRENSQTQPGYVQREVRFRCGDVRKVMLDPMTDPKWYGETHDCPDCVEAGEIGAMDEALGFARMDNSYTSRQQTYASDKRVAMMAMLAKEYGFKTDKAVVEIISTVLGVRDGSVDISSAIGTYGKPLLDSASGLMDETDVRFVLDTWEGKDKSRKTYRANKSRMRDLADRYDGHFLSTSVPATEAEVEWDDGNVPGGTVDVVGDPSSGEGAQMTLPGADLDSIGNGSVRKTKPVTSDAVTIVVETVEVDDVNGETTNPKPNGTARKERKVTKTSDEFGDGKGDMDVKTLHSYVIAAKTMDDVIRGNVDGSLLALAFDEFCENPGRGIFAYHDLAMKYGSELSDDEREEVTKALIGVPKDLPSDLTDNDRYHLVLDWYDALVVEGSDETGTDVAEEAPSQTSEAAVQQTSYIDVSGWITAKEAAERVGVKSTNTVASMSRDGRLVGTKLASDGLWHIDPKSVDALAAERDRLGRIPKPGEWEYSAD